MKPSPSLLVGLALVATAWLMPDEGANGQVMTVLHSFGDGSVPSDGANPEGTLVLGTDGNLYGATFGGGTASEGCVFKMTPAGAVTVLHSFGDGSVANDGFYPESGLAQGLDGNFYGTTESGGTASEGTIYKITPQGQESIVHSFGDGTVTNDGSYPGTGLVLDAAGNLYGTTPDSTGAGYGTVYKLTLPNTITVLHVFASGPGDGASPRIVLTQGVDGNFYGTTPSGGSTSTGGFDTGDGTVFRISPQGAYQVLHNFGDGSVASDGADPGGSVVQAADGNFYGTTTAGGAFADGTFFKMTPQGTVTILRSFGDPTLLSPNTIFDDDGLSPYDSVVVGIDGNFYGVTRNGGATIGSTSITTPNLGNGTIFEITPQGGKTTLHSFGDGTLANDGVQPLRGLIQGPDGLLYGMVTSGGFAGRGIVYSIVPATPLLAGATTAAGVVTLPFSYQVAATNNPISFSATNLPDGLSIDSTKGVISGTPTTVETNAVTLTITNAAGNSTFTLTITIGALPVPAITSIPNAYGTVGTAFTYTTTANNNATSFAAMGLTGTGLSIDSTTGIISGTPTTAATIPVSVTATNATGTGAATNVSIQILAAVPMLSQEYNIVHEFGNGTVPNEGTLPVSILYGFDGNFYGVTQMGGAYPSNTSYAGAVYKVSPNGNASLFYSFDNASTGLGYPTTLIQAADGGFYGGTLELGTVGPTLFRLSPTAQLTVLHSFTGYGNLEGLVQATDGNIYGGASNPSASVSSSYTPGLMFKITPKGVVTILHHFEDGSVTNDGDDLIGMIQGTDGNFYGVTSGGGSANLGTVFEMTPQGAVTILHSFGTVTNDGQNPSAGVIEGTDGNFYGTAPNGGSTSTDGMIYKITPQGVFTVLHSFTFNAMTNPNDGEYPHASLIQGFDGNFYGTTQQGGTGNAGTVFQMTPAGAVTIIHTFIPASGGAEGYTPVHALVQTPAGNFYGVTEGGGTAGDGTLYSILANQSPFHVPVFTGAAFESSSIDLPFSFTPTAAFGASGSGVLSGNSVQPSSGGGIVDALVSLLPDTIRKAFSQTNWTLTGTLPNYLTFDPTSGTISGTPVQGGTFTVTMTPNNAIGSGTPETVTLYIDVPPGIESAANVSCVVGAPFSYLIESVPLATAYSATGLPGWLTANPGTGVISGTPPTAGNFLFNAVAQNASGQSVQPITLTVTGGGSSLPSITSSTTENAAIGYPFTYAIAATNSATSYSALALPPGLLFDGPSGTISGTPTTAGTYSIPISATNGAGTFASVLSLNVQVLTLPVINSTLSTIAAEGALFSYQIPATGIITTYAQTGLPAGLTLNPMTGLISGTPTGTGAFPVILTLTNALGSSPSTLNLTVSAPVEFAQWASSYSLGGSPSDTPKSDGVPNLMKYLYDIDPKVAMSATDRAALPVLGTVSSGGSSYITLTYRQYLLVGGISIHLQTSDDLETWQTLSSPDFSQQIGTDPNTGDPVIQVGVLANGSPEQFIRINVTQP